MTRCARRMVWLCVVGIAVASQTTLFAAETSALRAAAETITTAELKSHVDVLADDSLEGRRGGSRGGRAAGGYLAEKLQKLGLQGMGDDGTFFQSFAGGERNILALWEGSDPTLKKQFVIIGAHYDHVGYGTSTNSYGPTGYIHNGADDNASGVSGLMETIEAVTRLPERPKRSILFAFWDGEEEGLLGSKHWAANPTVPLKNIVLYINLDMIGRLRQSRVEVYGTRSSLGLRKLISGCNKDTNLWLDFTWEMKENSDHYTFYSRSVPTLMFHTGLHENYHRPSDDAHLLNVEGIEQVSRLVFAVVAEVADGEQTLAFRPESRREDPASKRAFEQALPATGPRFGLEWQDEIKDGTGAIVTRVTPGLPAAMAGLQEGDKIIRFGGLEVNSSFPLRQAVLAAKPTLDIEVQRAGEEENRKLQVKLAGSPTRLGLAWRDDPSEPGTVLVTQVVPGSAAHHAGLKVRDRIYEIGGQPFANSTEFRQRATTLPGPVELVTERSGRLFPLWLKPFDFPAN